MHIAIDAANIIRDRRGIGRYVRAMLARWLPASDLALTFVVPDLFLRRAKRRLATALGTDALDVVRRRDVIARRPDLVWYPWNGVTWLTSIATVATVHDVWPFVSPAPQASRRRHEQEPYRTTATRSAAIIANSQFTKSQIIDYLGVRDDRIHVVHMGTDNLLDNDNRQSEVTVEGGGRFVLFVGENEPRKGLDTLLASMPLLPDQLRSSTALVIAGKEGVVGRRGAIVESNGGAAAELTLKPVDEGGVRTVAAGEVSDAVLRKLYRAATVFAFPSRYEGFGLPILEAMSCGCPVVASAAASIPEVGGDAARYVPPGDAAALASLLAQVLQDESLRQSMRDAGLARARIFSWDACSDATLAVFAQAAGSVRRA